MSDERRGSPLRRLGRRDVIGGLAVLALVGGLVLFLQIRKADPGTAKYVTEHIKDPPDDCGEAEFGPLWQPELAAWKRRAVKSSSFICDEFGPAGSWARFGSSEDLEAALRASARVSGFVCRTDDELVRLEDLSSKAKKDTCAAFHGRPVTRRD